jgi:hypothetical protein
MLWLEIASNDGPANEDRPKLLAKIQDNLSMSLANASYGDSPAVEQWKKDLITAGPRYVLGDPPAVTTGFQVMSSLMQKGRYENEFLKDYGTALVSHERENLRGSGEPWYSGATLNYPDNGKNPNDPMAGFLEALGHNPEASLDFFNQETGEGDKRITNFEYFVGDAEHGRKWPGDSDGFDNLGHALESATLGYAYDSKEPAIPPVEHRHRSRRGTSERHWPWMSSAPTPILKCWRSRRALRAVSRALPPATWTASTIPWRTGEAWASFPTGTASTTGTKLDCETSDRATPSVSCATSRLTRRLTRRWRRRNRSTAPV